MVYKFSGTQGVVVVQAKIIHKRARVFENLVSVPFGKSVAARVVRVDAREQACPGRAAYWNVAMRLREANT